MLKIYARLKGQGRGIWIIGLLMIMGTVVKGQTVVTVGGGATITCPTTPTATWTTAPTGVTFSNWSRGSGVTCGSAANGLSGSGFNTASASASFTANKYFSVTITADATHTFTLNSIVWATAVSSGSANFDVQYSNNGGTVTTFGSQGSSTSSNTFTGSVNVAAGTSIVLYLIPSGIGAAGTTVRWVNGSTITVTAATLPAPILAITGSTSHGSVCLGSSASSINYTITNSGTVSATGVTVVSNNSQFVVSALSSTTIPAGGTATYTVTFTPSGAGAQSATITVASGTSGSNSPTSPLTGTGNATTAPVVTTAAASSITSTSATLNGTVTTLGVCPTTIQKGFVYSLTSDNANPTNGAAGVTTQNVASLSTGSYFINISGLTATGNYSYNSYLFDGTTYTYGSVQTFTTPSAILGITGTPTNHGTVCPNVSATPVTYTITNSGTVQADNVSVTSSDPQFVVSGLSSTTIATGGTATYNVTFTPSSAGSKSSTINVTTTTAGSISASSLLTGTGTTPVSQSVTSTAASSVTGTTASLNANVTAIGVCPSTTEKGFVYSLASANGNPVVGGSGVTKQSVAGVATGTYTLGLTGLATGTGYSYNSYVFDGTTYTYGSVQTFTTTSAILAISGTPTNHGSVCPAISASSVTYTITNSGAAAATGVSVISTDPQFVVSGLSSTTIAASGGTATYVVTFTPSSAGLKSAIINVTSTTPASNAPASSLSGTGMTTVSRAVTSSAATLITGTTATFNGNVTTLGVCPSSTSKGFVYSVTSVNNNPVNGGTGVTTIPVSGISTGAFTYAASGLSITTGYTYKSYVFDGTTYSYGTAVTFTTLVTSSTDYFRSAVTTGNWSTPSSWESSPDNGITTFTTASSAPTSSAAAITIRTGHTINISLTESANKLTIQTGATLNCGGTSFTIADATGDDVTLAANSNFNITGSSGVINLSGSANFRINTGAVLSLSGHTAMSNYHSTSYVYADGGIFEYATTSSPSIQFTLFQGQDVNAVPIFRYNSSISSSLGGATATVINGKLEISSGRTFNVSGVSSITARNGIIGSGTITNTTNTPTLITGSTAEIGGTGNIDTYVTISSGSVTTLSSSKPFLTNNILVVNGTLDMQGFQMAVPSGSSSVSVGTAGILRTSHASGLTGGGSFGSNTTISSLANGSTVEYYATTAQVITALSYQNLTLNGNSVKTGAAAFSVGSTGQSPAFNINAGTFVMGGNLTLTNLSNAVTTIANGATLNTGNSTNQIIGSGTASVIVNGTFITQHTSGFTGGGAAVPGITVTLNSGCTVEYGLAGNQAVTNNNYQYLTFSGSGTKSTGGAISSITGNVTVQSGVTLNVASFSFPSTGASATNLILNGTARFMNGGSGVKPDIGGTYTMATSSTVEFTGTSATSIRLLSNYGNVEVSGTNVSLSSHLTVLHPITSFKVNSGGTFNVDNDNGLSGSTITAIYSLNPVLAAGSTIKYNYAGDQVITNNVSYENLTIAGTGIKTATSNSMGVNGNFYNAGTATFAHSNGTVVFAGTSSQTVSSAAGSSATAFYDVSLLNTTGVVVNDSISIEDKMSFGASSKLTLNTGNVVIRSTALKTASVATIPASASIAYTGTGRFIIERFISSSRRWQFLGIPVFDSSPLTIQNSWMEGNTPGANTKPGLGTWITDPAVSPTGFDAQSVTASMKYWNGSAYQNITDPTAFNILQYPAYFTFVRGDRSATGSGSGLSIYNTTTLRTKGKIYTGSTTPISVPAFNDYVAMTNPYASASDLSQLVTTDGQITVLSIWDPKLGGAQGLGGYQYLTRPALGGDFTLFPSGGSYTNVLANGIMNTLESGQAFFVKPSTNNNNVSFVEASKTVQSHDVNFTSGQLQRVSGFLDIREASINTMMDGFLVNMDTHFNTIADNTDAKKLINTNENVSVKRGSTLMAIEFRNLPAEFDTIQINIANMRAKDYRWRFTMENMDAPGRVAFLKDKYTNTTLPLNLTAENTYDFTVVNVTGSYAPDRFMIVFQQAAGTVPVTFTTINANRLVDKTIAVKWHVENETAISKYEVQRSHNGSLFTSMNETQATNNGGNADYNFIDAAPLKADNYYRIRSTGNNGDIKYSDVVKVISADMQPMLSINPNPVENKTLHLQGINQPEGIYSITLINNSGQTIYKTSMNVTAGSYIKSIELPKTIAAANYKLVLINESETQTLNVVIR